MLNFEMNSTGCENVVHMAVIDNSMPTLLQTPVWQPRNAFMLIINSTVYFIIF